MIAYKLTDHKMQTYNNTQWQIGEWKETDGSGDLCSSGWLHYYSDPLLAIFLNPVHANFVNPRLFEIKIAGDIKEDGDLKFGCTKMQLVKELEPPAVTLEQRVKFAILCALEVCASPAFVKWANNWLNGTDRSAEAAYAVKSYVSNNLLNISFAAYYASIAATLPYNANSWVARAASAAFWFSIESIDLLAIAKKAME